MSGVLQEIITLLTSGLTAMAQGIGGGLNQMVTSAFLDTSGSSPVLSTFGGVVVIFGGVALAIGITKLVTNWLMGWGKA